MHAVISKRVEIVVRLRRIQRRTDRVDAGVRNGSCGKASVRVGVVRADDRLVGVREHFLALVQRVLNRRVDLQARIELAAKTVVDDGGNRRALGRFCRLLFNQRRDDDHIVERELHAFDLLLGKIVCPHLRSQSVVQLVHSGVHLVRDLAFKVPQELAEDIFRLVVQIELVRIREQVALEAVLVTVGKVL